MQWIVSTLQTERSNLSKLKSCSGYQLTPHLRNATSVDGESPSPSHIQEVSRLPCMLFPEGYRRPAPAASVKLSCFSTHANARNINTARPAASSRPPQLWRYTTANIVQCIRTPYIAWLIYVLPCGRLMTLVGEVDRRAVCKSSFDMATCGD
jgi:hypothetical protein